MLLLTALLLVQAAPPRVPLAGGWPIDKTPDPSHLYVDYVRVYERKR